MPSAAEMNKAIAQQFENQGYTDLTIEVDDEFVAGMSIQFDKLDVTWLVGCWLPQRYAVVSGSLQLPRGKVSVRAVSLSLDVAFTGFEFAFEDLRASIECHDEFVSGGIGTGTDAKPLQADKMSVKGALHIECGKGRPSWGPICAALGLQMLISKIRSCRCSRR